MATVDVIIPSYNHRQFIEQLIPSILENANTVPLHIYVVDDCSTDDSAEYLRSLSDPRISVHINEKNMGTSFAINKATEMGDAPFVAHVGSDDLWHPQKLMKQLQAIENEPEKVSFSLVEYIDELGEILPDGYGPYNQNTFQCHPQWNRYDWLRLLSKGGNQLCAPSFLGRRAIVEKAGPLDLRLRQTQDIDLWARIFQFSDPIILPEKLVYYRLHSDSSNLSGRNKQNSARLSIESLLLARKFYKNVPDEIFKRMYASLIKRAGRFPFDTKIRVMMATNVQRLQLVAMEMLAENIESKRECSALTHLDFHHLAGQLRS